MRRLSYMLLALAVLAHRTRADELAYTVSISYGDKALIVTERLRNVSAKTLVFTEYIDACGGLPALHLQAITSSDPFAKRADIADEGKRRPSRRADLITLAPGASKTFTSTFASPTEVPLKLVQENRAYTITLTKSAPLDVVVCRTLPTSTTLTQLVRPGETLASGTLCSPSLRVPYQVFAP
jgi:hypothetical protein